MDCCSSIKKDKETTSKPNVCPVCQNASSTVSIKTVKHWLKASFIPEAPEENFYFCSSSDCPVVYFSEGGTRYKREDVRAVKDKEGLVPVCYCFGVTGEMIKREIAEKGKSGFSKWIEIEVKNGNCACDIKNPSGRCCLAELKQIEAIRGDLERVEKYVY